MNNRKLRFKADHKNWLSAGIFKLGLKFKTNLYFDRAVYYKVKTINQK